MLLLDTDVMVDILRRYPPAVAWLTSPDDDEEVILVGFVVMELLDGCRNRAEQRRLESALRPFSVLWPTPETCDEALAVFAGFHLSHRIGVLDAPLVTFNQKHYAAVPNLKTLQPYSKA